MAMGTYSELELNEAEQAQVHEGPFFNNDILNERDSVVQKKSLHMSRSGTNTSKREYVSVIDGLDLIAEEANNVEPVFEADERAEETQMSEALTPRTRKSVGQFRGSENKPLMDTSYKHKPRKSTQAISNNGSSKD